MSGIITLDTGHGYWQSRIVNFKLLAKENQIKDVFWIVLAWLLALAIAYVVFIKIKFIIH